MKPLFRLLIACAIVFLLILAGATAIVLLNELLFPEPERERAGMLTFVILCGFLLFWLVGIGAGVVLWRRLGRIT